MIRGTVCSNAGTYGSVGALGEQSPRATRSDAAKYHGELKEVLSARGHLCAYDETLRRVELPNRSELADDVGRDVVADGVSLDSLILGGYVVVHE